MIIKYKGKSVIERPLNTHLFIVFVILFSIIFNI